jgi:hypothetical protein
VTTPTATTWKIPRESKEWVGPITVTITVNGVTTTVDPSEVKFAVLPKGRRPAPTDWAAPIAEPGGDGIGVQADPAAGYGWFGIWAQITDTPEIPVLEPDDVGHILRT